MAHVEREFSPLNDLVGVLAQAGFHTEWMPSREGYAEQLLVVIAEAAGHPLIARLTWLEERQQAALRLRSGAAEQPLRQPEHWHLEMVITLPVMVASERAEDLNLLALWHASELPFGTYLVDAEGQLLFKHTLLCSSPLGQGAVLLQTLHLVQPALTQQLPLLVRFAEGQGSPFSQWAVRHA